MPDVRNVEVSQAKRSTATSGTAVRPRKGAEPSGNPTGPELDADAAIRPGMRRFSPRRRDVIEEGEEYGKRVAEKRVDLGMTRNDLAARIGTLPTTIASIEEGYLPRVKIRNQLAVALNGEPSSRTRPAPSDSSPRSRPRGSRLPVGAGWFLWGLPVLILIAAGLAVGAVLVAGQLSGGDSGPPVQRLVAVSSGLGPAASIHQARVQAQKAAAEARRAAEKRRERADAAAAAAAAAAARKAAAKQAHQSVPTQTQPVAQPVAPSPAPSGGGGGGAGGSSGGAPSLQHGIGGGG